MSTLIALAKALAVERGVAQPICLARHVYLAAEPLVLIPLGMAGEANAPLAIMTGSAPNAARLLTVAEPRDRDERFAFAAELAGIVTGYLDSTQDPQLVVPNPASLSFLKLLGRSTRFRRTSGEWAVPEQVPVLGRWLTFFADQSEHPASSLLLAMTEALARHWATGQSGLEDGNLATLLAWIDPPPGMSGAQAARLAEDPVAHPPAGPATDPVFDNEVLQPLVHALRAAKLTGGGRHYDQARVRLDEALATQIAPTWTLIWRGITMLRQLPEAGHVPERWARDRQAVQDYAEYIRDAGLPQARRDSAVSAARRLANLEYAQDAVAAQQAFDDPLVMARYRMTGEAFAGEVISAEPGRLTHTGKRQVLRPLITVVTRDGFRVPDNARQLISPSRPAQKAELVSVNGDRLTLELSGGMGRKLTPEPGSVPAVGERVCYATFGDRYQPAPAFPDPQDTPWTHGGPPPQYVPSGDDAVEEWS